MSRTVAVIPASDLSPSELCATVGALPTNWLIIISANGLPPSTVQIASNLSSDRSVTVIESETVLGKAEAVRRALDAALRVTTFDTAVQIDGHAKQPPGQAVSVVAAVEQGASMAVANRYAYQDLTYQPHRRAISCAVSLIIKTLVGVDLPDTACGLRAYSSSLAETFATDLVAYGYGLEADQLCIAGMARASVCAVPVRSNHQADGTDTEKLEDVFHAIALRARQAKASEAQCSALYEYITALKRRVEFTIEFPWADMWSPVVMSYVGQVGDLSDAYSARFVEPFSSGQAATGSSLA